MNHETNLNIGSSEMATSLRPEVHCAHAKTDAVQNGTRTCELIVTT